jgi:hypothetical protein
MIIMIIMIIVPIMIMILNIMIIMIVMTTMTMIMMIIIMTIMISMIITIIAIMIRRMFGRLGAVQAAGSGVQATSSWACGQFRSVWPVYGKTRVRSIHRVYVSDYVLVAACFRAVQDFARGSARPP